MKIGEYIQQELISRGWSIDDLAAKMPGNRTSNGLMLVMMMTLSDDSLDLDDATAKEISVALGVHPDFIGDLYKQLNGGL